MPGKRSPGYIVSVASTESLLDITAEFVFAVIPSALYASIWDFIGWEVVSGKEPLRVNPRGIPLFGPGGIPLIKTRVTK